MLIPLCCIFRRICLATSAPLSDLLMLLCYAECSGRAVFQPLFKVVCFIHTLRNVKGFRVLEGFTGSERMEPAYKAEGTKTA